MLHRIWYLNKDRTLNKTSDQMNEGWYHSMFGPCNCRGPAIVRYSVLWRLTSGAVHVSCSLHVAAESESVSHLYSDGCSRISRDVITQRQLTANAHVPYCISDQRALADFQNSLFTCDVAKNSMPCYNNTMTCSEPPTHSLEVPFCDACCGWAG